jgi:hypothetical protein
MSHDKSLPLDSSKTILFSYETVSSECKYTLSHNYLEKELVLTDRYYRNILEFTTLRSLVYCHYFVIRPFV